MQGPTAKVAIPGTGEDHCCDRSELSLWNLGEQYVNTDKQLCWVLVGFNLQILNSVLGRITQTPNFKLGLTYFGYDLPLVPLDFNHAMLFSRGQRGEAGVQQVPCGMEETFQREK